jgi:serine/threonine protein kinase/Tol biopolymer transport system component
MTDRGHDASGSTPASLVGRQLGSYHVLSLLGVGGMGEVYRASDATLERDVAIKIVTPFFADDPERLRRFEREARLLAALNHPHIGAIYGVEEIESVRFLVLELVDGETLSDRIARAPQAIPFDEALAIAQQLAAGLDAAHEKGIIHRDLKPANIKVTADGIVKVLDFGLAKIDTPDKSASDLSQSPTVTVRGTRAGVILGTAAYMSPEQTRGRPLDKRTDIWAFGCVIYEMLTGRAAFAGDTVSDTIAAILGREPDWAALPASTPAGVRRVLKRCLEKDAKRRLRDIGDAKVDLESAIGDAAAQSDASDASSTKLVQRLRFAVGVLAALLTVSLVASAALLWRKTPAPPPEPVRRFSMELGYVRPVLSPDGRHIAYRSDGKLWIRDVSSETPREIPAGRGAGDYYSDAAYYLTWSPDSRDLVFLADNELRRVSVAQGGAAATICALPEGRSTGRQVGGVAWSRDGETIVFSRYGAGIYRVSTRAGAPTLLWKEDHADDLILFATPQGQAIVFAVDGDGHTLIVRTEDGQRKVLAQLGTSWPELVYSPSGHILYRQDPVESPSIWALPFSATTLTTQGKPFLVERSGQGMSLSSDGALAYLDTGRIRSQRLAWRDRSGKIVEQSDHAHDTVDALAISPDGTRAIITAQDGGKAEYWLYDVQRFVRTLFELGRESDGARKLRAFFSRSGDEIVYTLLKTPTQTAVFARPTDGFGEARVLWTPDGFNVALDGSADGRLLVGAGSAPGPPIANPTVNVWFWRQDSKGGKGEAVNFSQNSAREWAMTLSPDGRYLAYSSTIGGQLDVYVRPFPEGRGRWQVSTHGGSAPAWGHDGKELFFVDGNVLMRVAVSTVGEFSMGSPEMLFEHPTLRFGPASVARYGVGRDGQKFLTVETERDRTTPVVRYVQNWLADFSSAATR